MDSKQVSQATTGVLVIVVGVILLGHQMRLGLDFGRLWPVLLLVWGISQFLSTDEEGRRHGGGWLILAGTLFLLNNFRVLGLGDSWPLFIVAAGIGLVFGRGGGRSRRRSTSDPATPPPVADRFGGDGRFQP